MSSGLMLAVTIYSIMIAGFVPFSGQGEVFRWDELFDRSLKAKGWRGMADELSGSRETTG
jgi:hypothetical protein